ncbi:hypothetical protein FOCC_FOCC007016 [Frankliniella occidentalis]|nr:hypothetical protein FOCC_FOCC007016 [Frankliniella occidentalis]
MSRNGRCMDLIQEKVTREQCCALTAAGGSHGASTAWSEKDMDAGMLFFWRVLGDGVPCQACRDSCAGVTCGAGRRCAVRWGRPQCVCAPDCSRKRLASLYNPGAAGVASGTSGTASATTYAGPTAGPVCGSDGRSYRSACRLLKRACRRQDSNLADQNLSPHCVRCERRCPSAGRSRAVCGADGTNYPSPCHLREGACRAGKAIPVAYRGRCQRVATCGAVHCRRHQSCLTDMATGAPRCVTCSLRCPRAGAGKSTAVAAAGSAARRHGGSRVAHGRRSSGGGGGARIRELVSLDAATELVQGGPLCGSNNRTYLSWCHMRKDACATGYVIDTKHSGVCSAGGQDQDAVDESRPGKDPAPHLNAVLEGNTFA